MKLIDLLEEIKPLLIIAGVSAKQINIKNISAKVDILLDAYDWLHEIKISKEYKDIEYAWGLLPEEVWKNYETFSITGLREQMILEKARKALLKRWRTKRPRIFGTKRNEKST